MKKAPPSTIGSPFLTRVLLLRDDERPDVRELNLMLTTVTSAGFLHREHKLKFRLDEDFSEVAGRLRDLADRLDHQYGEHV